MKKWIVALVVTTALLGGASAQTVIDAWHYTGVTDGTGLKDDPGCASTGVVGGVYWPDKDIVVVSNEMQRWESDGSGNAYSDAVPSSPRVAGALDGKFELSYDVVSADFSNTALSDKDAALGYLIREMLDDDAGIRIAYKGSVSTNVTEEGVTNTVNHDEIVVQYIDKENQWTEITNFTGHVVNDLSLRAVYDITNRGKAGSLEMHVSLAGTEIAVTTGTLSSQFALNSIRQAVSAGSDWQIGDVVMVDNIVLTQIEPPSPKPQVYGTMDEWTFDTEPDGTVFPHIVNSGPEPYGKAIWTGAEKPFVFVTNDALRVVADPAAALYTQTTVSRPFNETGLYILEFSFKDVVWDSATENYGKVELGFRDGSLEENTFSVFLTHANGKTLLKAQGQEAITLLTLPENKLSNFVIRAEADYDTDTVDIYTNGVMAIDDMPMLQPNMIFDQIRFVGNGKAGRMGPTDYVEIGYIKISGPEPINTPTSLYDDWVNSFSSLSDTNMEVDADGDGFATLTEYAFGGDPSDPADAGTLPDASFIESDGTNYVQYIYVERTDAADRGLTSLLEHAFDLPSDSWADAKGYETGRGPSGTPGFNAVTNVIPMSASEQFLRLQIKFVP